jgi:hypothetical protein
MITIATAGNVLVPILLALKQRGYSVIRTADNNWRATSGECELIGADPVELLALAAMFETRGADWQASDAEIEDYLERYEPSSRDL